MVVLDNYSNIARLQAVPIWIDESSREIAKREKKKILEGTRGGGLGERQEKSLLVYFSSLQSRCAVSQPSRLTRKGLFAVYNIAFTGLNRTLNKIFLTVAETARSFAMWDEDAVRPSGGQKERKWNEYCSRTCIKRSPSITVSGLLPNPENYFITVILTSIKRSRSSFTYSQRKEYDSNVVTNSVLGT